MRKDQGKIYQTCRASPQEENKAVLCLLGSRNKTHMPKQNKEWTKSVSLCVYVCTYALYTHTHTHISFKSSNLASLLILHITCSSYQTHTKVDSVQS